MTTWNEILAEEMQKTIIRSYKLLFKKEEQKLEYFLKKRMFLML